jgi:hypothetical protein
MTDNWPRYEPVTFSTGVNVSPENLDILNQAGLPKTFLTGPLTSEDPVGVEVPGVGYLIRFESNTFDGTYLDPMTGNVLCIYNNQDPQPYPQFVNTTLGQYVKTLNALIEAFPFYDDLDRDLNEVDVEVLAAEYEASATRLADIIQAIDPAALVSDSFWANFLDDVRQGDFGTKAVLTARQGSE